MIQHEISTGTRLLTHAANRLIAEDQEIACVSACATGGHVSIFNNF